MQKSFLVMGVQSYLGARSEVVLRYFKADTTEDAVQIARERERDDDGNHMKSLKGKRLFEEVELPK